MDAVLEPQQTRIGRRVVLGMLAAGAVGIVFGGRLTSTVSDLAAPLTGDGFRIYSVAGYSPATPPAEYALAVGGLATNSLRLTYADLQAMPSTTLTRDFQCVTGWRVAGVRWTGVALRDVLDRAGVAPAAKAVTFRSSDRVYTESLTLDQARRDDVLVAYEMQGAPITDRHGGPVRLLVAPMYGYKSLKWLSHIDLVDAVEPGYWEQEGYDVDAWVGSSNGRQDAPTS
ncbi:MAG TPA: molybdopterin-dependent oxidoreductase [Acidimicrobiales bacterium]|nr:molybdopterin-dependent oxidoreductase [Acidimicrobiales bacterium]